MAHVGAVRQVVRAEAAGHQLVQERCFVTGSTGGVEHRLVRVGQPTQLAGDLAESCGPRDRFVVGAARVFDHRTGQAVGPTEPIVEPVAKIGETVLGEERVIDASFRCGFCDGFGATFAEVDTMSIPGCSLGPCAPGTVEAARLVDHQQRPHSAGCTHLGHGSCTLVVIAGRPVAHDSGLSISLTASSTVTSENPTACARRTGSATVTVSDG